MYLLRLRFQYRDHGEPRRERLLIDILPSPFERARRTRRTVTCPRVIESRRPIACLDSGDELVRIADFLSHRYLAPSQVLAPCPRFRGEHYQCGRLYAIWVILYRIHAVLYRIHCFPPWIWRIPRTRKYCLYDLP